MDANMTPRERLEHILHMGGKVVEALQWPTIDASEKFVFTVELSMVDKAHYKAEYNSDGALKGRLAQKIADKYGE